MAQREAEGMAVSSSVCTICFEAVRDARLLDCLHSFCKGCLDNWSMRNRRENKIACPTCRSTCYLPESGAAGLPRDITVEVDTASQCSTCTTEHREGKAEVSCTACSLTFCNQHALPHVKATGHSVGPISHNAAPSSRPSSYSCYSSSARLCYKHGTTAKYFCQQCNVAVCGDCLAFGQHHGHTPIVTVEDVALKLKERVRRKTNHLRKTFFPEAQRSLSAVKDVSDQLSARVDSIRSEIQASAKRLHDAVDLAMREKLAQVDDLEDLRLKHLNNQLDDIKILSDGVKSVLSFGEKLMEADAEREEVCELLQAVEKRADELEEALVAEKPVEHARVDFESVDDETVLAKASELVGVVLPCKASAKHSLVEGKTSLPCVEGSSVSYVVVAKDCNNCRLATGGDTISVESQQTLGSADPVPTVDIVDNDDGTYKVTITSQQQAYGDYSFDVFVNNERLQQRLSIQGRLMTFDSAECQEENALSEDKLTVTHTGRAKWSSVLGSRAMETGQHVWSVKVTKTNCVSVHLGVAQKPGLTAKEKNYWSSYSWYGLNGERWSLGNRQKSMSGWQENDILQLHLNCSKHTLTIKNIRSGEKATIVNLPPTKLFAYFLTYHTSDSLTLVPTF